MRKGEQKKQACISVTKKDVRRIIDSNAQSLGISTRTALKRVRTGTLNCNDIRWADISMLDTMLRAK